MDAETALIEFIDSDAPIEEVADALVNMHGFKGSIGDMYSTLSVKVLAVLQNAKVEDMELHGARIEVRSAADRKQWNHSELASTVTKRLIDMSVDMDTGEVVLSQYDIANKLLEFVQPSYWRIKELAKIGINADTFCEVGDYKTNIIIRKAK